MSTPDHRTRVATNLVLGAGIMGCAVMLLLPSTTASWLTREGGLVENLTAFAAACAVAAGGLQTVRIRSLVWCSATLLMFGLFLRELDFQKMFTPRSVESLGFYSNPDIALFTKLLAIAAYTPFFVAGAHLAFIGLSSWRIARPAWPAWSRPVFIAGAVLCAALAGEKLLAPHGQIVEETLELVFVSLVLLVLVSQITSPARVRSHAFQEETIRSHGNLRESAFRTESAPETPAPAP